MFAQILLAAQISITLSATKATVSVAEGTRLVERWTVDQTTHVVVGGALFLDDGSGFRPFIAEDFEEVSGLDAPVRLEPGPGRLVNHDLLVESVQGKARMVFGRPGVFRFQIRTPSTVSNTVEITVQSTTDPQAATISARPELTSWLVRVDPELRPIAQNLIETSPLSALATPTWLNLHRSILEEIPAAEARSRLEQIRSANWKDSAFAEDVGLFIAEWTSRLSDKEAARPRYEDLLRDYPNSAAAMIARSWLVDNRFDTGAPVVLAVSTPSVLWPPNKRLIAITVSVSASDDSGTAPSIALVAITCDDACDPSSDIAGAAFGTDDREFQLQATRTGGGKGRTYTITYEATDAAGNKTTTTTTVLVPHDQGKK